MQLRKMWDLYYYLDHPRVWWVRNICDIRRLHGHDSGHAISPNRCLNYLARFNYLPFTTNSAASDSRKTTDRFHSRPTILSQTLKNRITYR